MVAAYLSGGPPGGAHGGCRGGRGEVRDVHDLQPARFAREINITFVDHHVNESELFKIKEEVGVPGNLSASHTILTSAGRRRHFIEGYVPFNHVHNLIFGKPPDAVGLAVRGEEVYVILQDGREEKISPLSEKSEQHHRTWSKPLFCRHRGKLHSASGTRKKIPSAC